MVSYPARMKEVAWLVAHSPFSSAILPTFGRMRARKLPGSTALGRWLALPPADAEVVAAAAAAKVVPECCRLCWMSSVPTSLSALRDASSCTDGFQTADKLVPAANSSLRYTAAQALSPQLPINLLEGGIGCHVGHPLDEALALSEQEEHAKIDVGEACGGTAHRESDF